MMAPPMAMGAPFSPAGPSPSVHRRSERQTKPRAAQQQRWPSPPIHQLCWHHMPRADRLAAVAHSPIRGEEHATQHSPASRRAALLFITASAAAAGGFPGQALASEVEDLERLAFEAYANREFGAAVDLVTQLLQRATQPADSARLYEMRAQVLVDGKSFSQALQDFDAALRLTPASELTTRARLLSGQALAREGLSDWRGALSDYDQALELADQGGESPDPYIVNARGNCHNSLGEWQEARDNYLLSSQLFQQAKGFRGAGGSTTQRLDGAVFAASNAALMLAQLGDEDGAVKEMERIARRAPGSVDMRAALAALQWARGQPEAAEANWQFACEAITTGCSKYRDPDWLTRVRRWPPRMVEKMGGFLTLKQG